MQDGKQLKYGHIRGGEQGFDAVVMTTQYIAAASGRFVKRTASDSAFVTLATQSDTEILGHLETEQLNSSNGTEVRKVICDPTAVYRLPVVGTYTTKMKGKKCDLLINATIQKAAVNSADIGQLIIVGGDDVNNNWVDVMLNQYVIGIGRVGVV